MRRFISAMIVGILPNAKDGGNVAGGERKWSGRSGNPLQKLLSLSLMAAVIFTTVLGVSPQQARAATTTILVDDEIVDDWNDVASTSINDTPRDVTNVSGPDDLVKLWVTNDADTLYARFDIWLQGQTTSLKSDAYGILLWRTTSDTLPFAIGWVGFDSQGSRVVSIEKNFVSKTKSDPVPLCTSPCNAFAQQINTGTTRTISSLEVRFPLADLGLTPGEDIYITAESHASASYQSVVKDAVPDGGFMWYHLTDGTWDPCRTGPIINIEATVNPESVATAGYLDYTVTYRNVGSSESIDCGDGSANTDSTTTITGISADLPSGFIYTGPASGVTANPPTGTSGTISWSGLSATLSPTAARTQTFRVKAGSSAGKFYTNASVTVAGNTKPFQTGDTALVTVVAPEPASAANSVIWATPLSLPADGASKSAITVQLKDAAGNNTTVSGGAVVLTLTGTGLLGNVTDNGDGTYSAQLTAPVAVGSGTITGTLNGQPIGTSATVNYTIGPASAATSTIAADPTSMTANGTSKSTITVQLEDAQGRNLTSGGDSVALSRTGTGTLGPVTDKGDGTYTAELTAPSSAGSATITGTVNGQAMTNQATVEFTAAAAPPTITISGGESVVTNDAAPLVEGTTNAADGRTVTVTVNGKTYTANAGGNAWSVTVTDTLPDGDHIVTAAVDDGLGNSGSDTQTLTVDTAAPVVTVTAPANGSTTNDSTPDFTGTAEANSTVKLYVDGSLVTTLTADGSGNWSYTLPGALTDGDHSVYAMATDAAGNTGTSATNTFTVDTTAPAVTVTAPANGSTTNENTPTITGTAEPNSTVKVYLDGSLVATVTADGSGNWSYTPSTPLGDGSHTVHAEETDTAGNTGTSEINTFAVTTAGPAITISGGKSVLTNDATPVVAGTTSAADGRPVTVTVNNKSYPTTATGGAWTVTVTDPLPQGAHTVTATVTDGLGNSGSDTQTLTVDTVPPVVAVTAPGDGSTTNDSTPTITGTAEADSAVKVYVDGSLVATVTADGSGNWSYTPSTPLGDGSHTVHAEETDTAGNTGASETNTFTVDTAAPAVAVSSPVNGSITNDNTPTFTGTADVGSTIKLFVDGAEVATPTVDGAGNWSYTPTTPLGDGAHSVYATATDADSNTGTSGTNAFTVDTLPPAVAVTAPANGGSTNDNSPTVTGTAEPNSTVKVYVDGTLVATVTADGSGNWSYTLPGALTDGSHTVYATATDTAGNTGTSATNTFTVTTVGPVITISGGESVLTKDTTPAVAGTTSAANGRPVTVTVAGKTYSTTANGGGWSVTVTDTLSQGPHTVTATVTDALGNSGTDTQTLTVDSVRPDVALRSPTNGSTTTDRTPTITGTAEPGSTVKLYVDGALVATLTAGANGNWSHTLTSALDDGSHSVYATATDAAGNTGNSGTRTFTVDRPSVGSIWGEVTTAGGRPVAGAAVELTTTSGTRVGRVTTTSTGRYTFSNVPAGVYIVTALPDTRAATDDQVRLTTGASVEVNFVLSATAQLDVTAAPASLVGDGVSTSTITATVIPYDGSELRNVPVAFATTAGRLSRSLAYTTTGGTATTILTSAALSGITERREQVVVTAIDVNRGIIAEETIQITFMPAAIDGVVVDAATGRPAAGARVEIAEDFNGDGIIDFTASVTTGADGRYHILVPRGNWTYHSRITTMTTVDGVTLPVTSVQDSPVGQLRGVGEQYTAKKTVSGQLFLSQPNSSSRSIANLVAQGSRVNAVLQPIGGGTPRSATVAADGQFRLEDVPVGRYKVHFDVISPDGRTLVGASVAVSVDTNGQLTVVSALIDPYGQVTDKATGRPVAGVTMKLYWADTALNRSKGRTPGALVTLPRLPGYPPLYNEVPQLTTSAGEYSWLVYPEGDYYIVATKAGYQEYNSLTERRTIPAAAGEDSYVQNGVIHVGTSIVRMDIGLTPAPTTPAPQPAPQPTPTPAPQPTPQPTPAPTPTPGPQPAPQPAPSPDSEEHIRYILGYPDGTFQPERSISRAEVATILARITLSTGVAAPAPGYSDLTPAHWAYRYIAVAKQLGLMVGDPGGSFRPESPVTRAELATIAVRFKKLTAAGGGAFPDARGHWAEAHIQAAFAAGIITGYPNGTFRPQQSATRAEFVTMVNRMLGRGPLTGKPSVTFPDVAPNHWAWGQVEEAATSHRYKREDGIELWWSTTQTQTW